MSFESVRRMSQTQLNKLTKEQLASALKDAINISGTTSFDSPRSDSSTKSVTREYLDKALDMKLSQYLNPLEKKISTLVESHKNLQNQCDLLRAELDNLKEFDQQYLLEEFEDRERRRDNIMIFGLTEKPDGTVPERDGHDRDMIREVLQSLGTCDEEIMDSRRVGKIIKGKARPMKVKLLNRSSKLNLIQRSKELRKSSNFRDVYIKSDLTKRQQREEFELRQELKRQRSDGRDVVIYKGQIRPKESLVNFPK